MAGTPDSKPESSFAETMQKLSPYLNIGWTFVGSMGFFMLVGYWLDGKFHTKPWLFVVGALLGITGGFISFFRIVLQNTKKSEKKTG
jgi:F0F1-type ATP synthase assembly protein I